MKQLTALALVVLAVALIATGARVLAGVPAASAAVGAGQGRRVQTVVSSMLPGARASLSHGRLQIRLPAADVPTHATRARQLATANELGWRARMAASIINRSQPIRRYTVTFDGGARLAGSGAALHGGFAGTGPFASEDDPKLGTVSPSLALKQAGASLNVLRRTLPPGSILGATVSVVSSGAGPGRRHLPLPQQWAIHLSQVERSRVSEQGRV